MQLNERQRLILMGVLQDQKRLAAMPWGDGHGMSRLAMGRDRLRIRQAREGMVPMALEAWLGHAPTNSDRVLCSREFQRLEDMGLVVRCNPMGGHRTTHLKLTPAGREVAQRVLAEEHGLENGPIGDINWASLDLTLTDTPTGKDEANDAQ